MKRRIQIAFMLALVSILCVSNINAEIIWDSGHHVFSEGSETYLTMLNDASADMTGGWVAEFSMYNETSLEVFGGTISQLLCQDISTATIYDNNYMDLLRPNDSSTANVYGGTINYIFALGYSITNIYGGFFDEIAAEDFSSVNLYVESYDWDPTGGARYGGLITGVWLESNESFNIDLVSEGTINHLNFVPEPATILLFGMGGLILRI